MKTSTLFASLLMAGLCASPLCAQEPATSPLTGKAVAMAAPASDAALPDICNAVYQAVKANPEEADEILAAVLAQRDNWTSEQVYAIFRATLMAIPELVNYIDAIRVVEAGTPEADAVEREAAASGAPSPVPPMLVNLISVLYQSPGVSEEAAQHVVATLVSPAPSFLAQLNQAINNGEMSSGGGQNTNASIGGDVVPEPDEVSPMH